MKARLPILRKNMLCFVGNVSEWKTSTELLKVEKEKLIEEVQILEGLSKNKDELIAECEAAIKHKERECVHYFPKKKVSSFPFIFTLRNGRGNHLFEAAVGGRKETTLF